MKISINWIRDINRRYQSAADPMPDGIDKLVDKIGAQLGAVDEVVNLGKKYEGIVAAKVISSQKHPNADKLSVCLIDDGGVVKGVKRDKNGHVQVVCGAANVRAALAVAWIPPGVVVPSTVHKDPLTLESRDIRGETSNGMLASPKELDLGDNHEGILEIDEKIKPGQPFAEIYGLDDYIIDIENKMFTHRPDCFGMLGIARELAGIQGHVFKSPAWYVPEAPLPAAKGAKLALSVDNRVQKQVPRFMILPISQVDVKPSPTWLQTYLSRVGIRPINNIVDVTNYVMLETAQPLHAYDYDKLKKLSDKDPVVQVRLSGAGEELTLLGGKRLKLDEGAIVIATDKQAVGLGGVMGGAETEVDEGTKNIILEAGTFDMNRTRKTAMEYGLFTDAATRFTKDQSPLQNRAALSRAVAEIINLAGGRVAGQLSDIKTGHNLPKPVSVTAGFINDRLGLSLAPSQIRKILESVEFKVSAHEEKLTVSAPFWRMDIEIPEDIVEEVGRLYGYDHLPQELPSRDISPAAVDPVLEFKSRLRDIMARSGANEVLSYSFVNRRLMEAAGHDPDETFYIRNALSPDLQYYRMSLLPSLLEKVHPNRKQGYTDFALFELGKVHAKWLIDDDGLPAECETLSLAVSTDMGGATYYQVRLMADELLRELNIPAVTYKPLSQAESNSKTSLLSMYEPERSAVVYSGEEPLGVVGEPSQALRRTLKLPSGTSIFELDVMKLLDNQQPKVYRPINRFPSISQDICLRVGADLSYQEIDLFLWHELDAYVQESGHSYEILTIDIFQRPKDEKHKQITWRVTLSHPERTLTTEEAVKIADVLAAKAKSKFGAQRV